MNTKLYRVTVSIVVEAYDEEDAYKEVMNEIFDDSMIIEGAAEIASSNTPEENFTSEIA